jgi:hypothetical protein
MPSSNEVRMQREVVSMPNLILDQRERPHTLVPTLRARARSAKVRATHRVLWGSNQ